MLKHRLIFGAIMIALLSVMLYFDGKIVVDYGQSHISGIIFAVLVGLVAIPAQFEMTALCQQKGCAVFLPISIPASILLSVSFFIGQFAPEFGTSYICLVFWLQMTVLSAAVLGSFFYQARKNGTESTIRNCGATLLSIMYLGFLSGFVMAMRIDFGLAVLLTYVFTVKSSDIGAYTLGRLFGKHKFAPRISPGKTWEGMAGACLFAAAVGSLFSSVVDGLIWPEGALFGVIFAFAGQLGDLAESMVKRDSGLKDSGSKVPGFGGVLDIVDSPVAAAPLAYLFFSIFI
ncbi:MAG: phosphatidate cytidylyltransferase [Sedimentisphaeraceae bacterium JB056]